MKYIKPIDIWAFGDKVRSGEIKLQRGQWVRLGAEGKLSRYYGTNGSSLTAFHYPNASSKFQLYVENVKKASEKKCA